MNYTEVGAETSGSTVRVSNPFLRRSARAMSAPAVVQQTAIISSTCGDAPLRKPASAAPRAENVVFRLVDRVNTCVRTLAGLNRSRTKLGGAFWPSKDSRQHKQREREIC